MQNISRTTVRVAVLAGCALAALGCSVPTDLPIWNTVWQVPADSAEVTVASLLPASVSIVDVGATKAFAFSLPQASTSTTLGESCYACASAAGTRIPKPAFTLADSATVQMPTDVVTADIIGGSIDYTLTNGFDFDPLNPGANARGWIRIRVTAGSALIANDSVNGSALALPPGAVSSRTINFLATPSAPIRLNGPVTLVATLFSPDGDSTTINTSEQFSVSASARDITISKVSVNVPSTTFTPQHGTVDLSGLDQATAGKIVGGAVILAINNPFAVGGSLSLDFKAPDGAHVVKGFTLGVGGPASAPSTIRLGLSQSEINSLIGQKDVAITITGSVSSPNGAVDVTPMQRMAITTLVEATIATGGN
ncbi:MAG: hypothetical protein ACJ79K_00990 [Gemmatimonadaceae bacterium]